MINERNFWNKLRILVTNKCNYRCPFCHNEGQEKEGKTDVLSLKDFVRFIEFVKEQDISELHFSGGEPFLNTQVTLSLCKRVREVYGSTKDIWSWSGYTFEELINGSEDKIELLKLIDVLVDGKFIEEKKDLNLAFRGSSNQKIIDVQRSLHSGSTVLWRDGDY